MGVKRGGIAMCLAATLLLVPGSSSAFTSLVAFGDSYTDTGRLPSSPPNYWNGRFSNGPLWIEYMSQMLGFAYDHANNYAVSGSESDELGIQINNYPGTTDSDNVLFAIWSGNNDFGNHLNIGYNDAGWNNQINSVISSLLTASDLLYQKGARNILLFNLVDLTRVPYILNAYPASFRSYVAAKIQTFNVTLANDLPAFRNSHPGLNLYLVDIHNDVNYLLDSYSNLGFTKASVDALDDPNLSDTSFSGPGADYVFWDSEHPTTKTHGLLAKWIFLLLPNPTPPPQITITSPQAGTQFTFPATISVNVSVAANGWGISQVSLYQNGALVAQTASAPYVFNLDPELNGAITLTAEASYGSGQTVSSGPVQVSVVPAQGSAPPVPWLHQDIGRVGLPGRVDYFTNGTFDVSGSGNDIWDVADSFHYCYVPCPGDGIITARVTSIQDTDGYAKAGLMFRASLDPGSPNVLACLTPANGLDFQWRSFQGGTSSYTDSTAAVVPSWIRLARRGETFTSSASADGSNWTLLWSVNVAMPKTIYVGLAVTAHNNTSLNTSSFDSVLVQSTSVVSKRRLSAPASRTSAE
ncbi:MAG TPA: SGNH/GDSL hydrolase family protein [Verrucomicrobiae bacterium]|nr:SGNH/GDSL hydrolase family protein [Verrucomicrobiae bacterium]